MCIHTGEKRFVCSHLGCTYKTSKYGNLKSHTYIHTGERPFGCTAPGCDARFLESTALKKHMKTHTIERQRYHKKQEKRVVKMLTQWGYTFDDEATINASRGECLTDTNRHYSRLDYNIINCVNAILLLEVDEHQHTFYNLSCEFSRMSDIRASLVTAGYELPIYWIRYNPNGKYHIGSEQVKTFRPKREIALKAKLEELCSPDFVPENQVNIHYMYYDLISKEIGPEIMTDCDFPDALQECVSWCV